MKNLLYFIVTLLLIYSTMIYAEPCVIEPTQEQLEDAKNLNANVNWNHRTGVPDFVEGILSRQMNGTGRDISKTFLTMNKRMFKIKNVNDELSFVRSNISEYGYEHIKYKQMYKGLPVIGGELIVHINKNREVNSVNGMFYPIDNISISPGISPSNAISIAETDLAFPTAVEKSVPELVIYPKDNCEYALAYRFTLSYEKDAEQIPGRWEYIIDANTGEVLRKFNKVCFVTPPQAGGSTVTGSGALTNQEGGTIQDFPVYFVNNTYYMYDYGTVAWGPSMNIGVYDSKSPTYYVSSLSQNTWPPSTTTNIPGLHVSTYYNLFKTAYYYSRVHQRDSFDNAGGFMNAEDNYGNNFVNAYWNGDHIVFGNGDNVIAGPLNVMDIVGHEYTHAVTQYEANLVYDGESGALNESFSDIFGTSIEFYAQDRGTGVGLSEWSLGEDCWTPGNGTGNDASRYMDNPQAGNQPSWYKGTFWKTIGDVVHINSGVQNHFYYILSEGVTNYTNDGHGPFTVPGIGEDPLHDEPDFNTRGLAYDVLTNRATLTTDYPQIRNLWIASAVANDKERGTNYTPSVVWAWDAVGVPGSGVDYLEPNNSSPGASVASNGSIQTAKISSATDEDYYSFWVLCDGDISIWMQPPLTKNYNIKLYNPNGVLVAQSTAGTGIKENISYSVTSSTHGRYVLCVYGHNGNYDVNTSYIFSVSAPPGPSRGIGCTVASIGIDIDKSAFSLEQNYPNPFNPQTTISYSLPTNNKVSIKVYNTNGELIRTLIDEVKESGSYSVSWNGKDSFGKEVSSGIYIYTIHSGEFRESKKMILMK